MLNQAVQKALDSDTDHGEGCKDKNATIHQKKQRLIPVFANSLYKCLGGTRAQKREATTAELQRENARLRSELLRVEEERDILKKAAAYFAKESH